MSPLRFAVSPFPASMLHSNGWRKVLFVLMETPQELKHCAETALNDTTDGISTEQNKTQLMQRKAAIIRLLFR